ncbi:MAG: hypothetical protein WCG39_04850, partial [Actinomycetes bacterium]
LYTRSFALLRALSNRTIKLFRKRDLVIIVFFTILGIGGVFAAGAITLTQTDKQGAGYTAVTSCDEAVSINKDVTFDLTLQRYVVSTISISNVNQTYDVNGRNGCGNMIMELALPYNGDVTYASWTIPSSTITDGVFTFGANSSTGITYRAYTSLTPVDAQSLASVALNLRPSTRAVTNGPVLDLLKDNGFTTVGQDASSSYITFALSLSCGTLTVDTTQPGVSAALAAMAAPTGYVTNNATSTGVNGGTSAAYLGLRGTVANINIILPWISYSWKSDCTNPLPTFQGAIWNAQPTGVTTPIAWNFGENGHYYQYISTAVSWDAAYLDITGQSAGWVASDAGDQTALPSTTRTYSSCPKKVFGLCGYFATVQTSTENAFLVSKVGLDSAWLGGNDRPVPAGASSSSGNVSFIWADPVAPEYNCVFFYGRGRAHTTPNYYPANRANCAVDNGSTRYSYQTFNLYQPDTWTSGRGSINETALQILSGGTGFWNDRFEDGYGGDTMGYIIEYGGSLASGEALNGGGSSTPSIIWHW